MWWIMLLTMALKSVSSHSSVSCEEARFRCAQREGCGNALHNYMSGCSAVLRGIEKNRCPEVCKNALIALTSTEEGKALMTCDCSDDFCEETKQRVEVCRAQVMTAHHDDAIVSCDLARMICQADPACSTAYDYYEDYCKSMFNGRKCTKRCKNSLSILQRQLKSKKLKSCRCEGPGAIECARAQRNNEKLCARKGGNKKKKGERRKEEDRYHEERNRHHQQQEKHHHHHQHGVYSNVENGHGGGGRGGDDRKEVEIQHVTDPVVRGDVFTNDIKTVRESNGGIQLRLDEILLVMVSLVSVILFRGS